MRKLLMTTGLIAALALPGLALGATRCRQDNSDRKVVGTVLGAVAGGLIGNAVASGGGREGGAVIGAVGGAVIGNQLAASSGERCPHGYVAYEDDERGYPANREAGPDRHDQVWRDGSGRECHWRHEEEDRADTPWVQACR